ncbi:hypothetical protein [Citreimonas salinaria]|uniref:Uncharacterized protein n=1 Tax=Citreimonas salinaria TaxID=321339 RepID=A0A1H3MGY0_9RHOB|nr:hypothetical protein [Citreimonas salinaria]SDY75967.1 hypothetical protein SAMN05444340_11724 [Citreimonas salinaria]
MRDYATNRRWSDQYLPRVKQIIAEHLLTEAPDPLDWHEATDLVTMDVNLRHVAVRVRRPGYAQRYPFDFTVRSSLPSGAETELSKIVNGHGDWMFYGHASASGDGIDAWWLIDLRAFRAALIRRGMAGNGIRCGNRRNADGTCFTWFDVRSFPQYPPLVVSASRPLLI